VSVEGSTTGTGGGGGGGAGGAAASSCTFTTSTSVPACSAWTLAVPTPGCSDVTGTAFDRHFLEDGTTVMAPQDLSSTAFFALVSRQGGVFAFPGTGKADGTFVVPGVPEGPYVLAVQVPPAPAIIFYATSARVLDLGFDQLGRPDAVQAGASTTISASFQTITHWAQGDEFTVGSFNAGHADVGAQDPGPKAMTSFEWSKRPWSGGLVDGTKGDSLYFVQRSHFPGPGGDFYEAVTSGAVSHAVEMVDGGDTPVSGALTYGPMETVSFDYRGTQFGALSPAIHPSLTPAGGATRIDIIGAPGATAWASGSQAAGVFQDMWLLSYSASGGDQTIGPVPYVNPFPPSWGESLRVEGGVQVDVPLPGASGTVAVQAWLSLTIPIAEASAGPIVPHLSPVRSPLVNGSSAYGLPTGVTTTPTLSWTPPVIGTPSGYFVYLAHYPGGGYSYPGVSLFTDDTSITVPACALVEGDAYVATISAVSTGVDLKAHPNRTTGELHWADAVTNGFKP
jgi:hypothetical protein